jgi:hypothetical protein
MESVGNSQIIQLLASSSSSDIDPTPHIFSGTPETTDGYGSIRTLVTASQPGILYMKQSIDCSYWDIVESFQYPSDDISLNTGMFQNTPVKSKYYKTEFHNTSDQTSDIRIQTMLHQDNIIPTTDVIIVNDQPIQVNISGGSEISGANLTPESPITEVWESDEISGSVNVHNGTLKIHTIHGTNFAPDYRFLKLYDISGEIDFETDKPKLTIPLTSDTPHGRTFGEKGLIFNKGLTVSVTRLLKYNDQNMGSSGDVLASITYTF